MNCLHKNGLGEDGHCADCNTYDLNSCDKCEEVQDTNTLVWITSEDFEPKENEIVSDEVYSKYDCLCEECYLEVIEVKQC